MWLNTLYFRSFWRYSTHSLSVRGCSVSDSLSLPALIIFSNSCGLSHTQADTLTQTHTHWQTLTCSPLSLGIVSCTLSKQLSSSKCQTGVFFLYYSIWASKWYIFPFCFQAHPLTHVADHTTAESLVVVREPVAASPHLPDWRGPRLRREGAHLRAAASAAVWVRP